MGFVISDHVVLQLLAWFPIIPQEFRQLAGDSTTTCRRFYRSAWMTAASSLLLVRTCFQNPGF